MSDYKAMYWKLFNSVTNAIQALQQAQLEAEEMYMNCEPDTIELHKRKDDDCDD